MTKRGVRCTRGNSSSKLKIDSLFKDKITLSVFVITAIFVLGFLYMNSLDLDNQDYSIKNLLTGAAVNAPTVSVNDSPILEVNETEIPEETISEKSQQGISAAAEPGDGITIQGNSSVSYVTLESSSLTNHPYIKS